MGNPINQICSLLREVVGYRLLSVIALLHTFEGEKDFSSPQELLLVFENNSQVRLRCDQDGESIIVDNEAPTESNLEEYGQNILYNYSNDNEIEFGIGKKVKQIELIVSDNIVFGVSIFYDTACSLTLLNLGDELYVYDEFPKYIVEEEKARRLLVR